MVNKTSRTNVKDIEVDFLLCRDRIVKWLIVFNKNHGRGIVLQDTYKIATTHKGKRANGTVTTRWQAGYNGSNEPYRYTQIRFDIIKGEITVKVGRDRITEKFANL